MADIKSIDLVIKGNDLASKPLTEIGAAIDKLVANVAQIVPASEKGEKNLAELTEMAGELKKALKNLAGNQAAIDEIGNLNTRVAEAEARLESMKAKLAEADAALAAAGGKNRVLEKDVTAATTAVTKQERALLGWQTRLTTAGTKATALGIDTKNLAASEATLNAALAQAGPAYTRVTAAVTNYTVHQRAAKEALAAQGAEERRMAENAAHWAEQERGATHAVREQSEALGHAKDKQKEFSEAWSLFRDEGRTTLSLFQRLRGELLSMGAELVGFYGIIEQVKKGFESIESLEGTKSILESTFGGVQQAGDQLKYVSEQAERLGFNYVTLAKQYAQFTAAAVNQGVSIQDAREVFETFEEAAKIKRLSAEDTSQIFAGLEKIYAKDTVGAGELFRKLTTQLPEIAAAFRNSIKDFNNTPLTTAKFDEYLKSGKISGDMLTAFAKKYRESFGEQLPKATHTAADELIRFGNAMDELRIQVLEGGALEAFAEALKEVTKYLKGDEGKQFTEALTKGLKVAAEGLVFFAGHLDGLRKGLEVLIGLWGLHVTVGFARDLKKLGTELIVVKDAMVLLNAKFNAAGLSLLTIGDGLKLLGAATASFFAGFAFGTWLDENFAAVRRFGSRYVEFFIQTFESVKLAFNIATGQGIAKSLEQFKAASKKIHDLMEEQRAGASIDPNAPPDAAKPEPEKDPATLAAEAASKKAAADAAQRLVDAKSLADQNALMLVSFKGVTDKIAEMRGSIQKKNATEMEAFKIGLDETMKPLYDEIQVIQEKALGNSAAYAAHLRAELAKYKQEALQDEQNTLDQKKAGVQLADIKAEMEARKAAIDAVEAKRASGNESQKTAMREIAAIETKSNDDVRGHIAATLDFIHSLPDAVQTKLHTEVLALQKIVDKLNKPIEPVNPIAAMKQSATDLLDLLKEREARMKEIDIQEKTGNITTVEAAKQLRAVAAEYPDLIRAAVAYSNVMLLSKDLTEDERAALKHVAEELKNTAATARQVPPSLITGVMLANELANGAVKVSEAFAKAVAHSKSLKDSFHAALTAFRQFASDFLIRIAEMIVKQTFLNALSDASKSTGSLGSIASFLSTGSHQGGMVGGSNFGSPRRAVASWFDNAPRYHTGGVVGLNSDEVPAILQRGEEVLAKNDSRNRANNGMAGGGSPQHIQVVNAIDHESVVRQGLQAPSNTKVILNLIRANRGAVKQALN